MRRIGTSRHGHSPRRRRAGYGITCLRRRELQQVSAVADARPDNNRGPDSLRCKMALDDGRLILAYRRTRPMVSGAGIDTQQRPQQQAISALLARIWNSRLHASAGLI